MFDVIARIGRSTGHRVCAAKHIAAINHAVDFYGQIEIVDIGVAGGRAYRIGPG